MSYPLEEVNKRRTFAIISHPDAGKTTITEKSIVIRQCHSKSRLSKKVKAQHSMQNLTGWKWKNNVVFPLRFRDAIPLQ